MKSSFTETTRANNLEISRSQIGFPCARDPVHVSCDCMGFSASEPRVLLAKCVNDMLFSLRMTFQYCAPEKCKESVFEVQIL